MGCSFVVRGVFSFRVVVVRVFLFVFVWCLRCFDFMCCVCDYVVLAVVLVCKLFYSCGFKAWGYVVACCLIVINSRAIEGFVWLLLMFVRVCMCCLLFLFGGALFFS